MRAAIHQAPDQPAAPEARSASGSDLTSFKEMLVEAVNMIRFPLSSCCIVVAIIL